MRPGFDMVNHRTAPRSSVEANSVTATQYRHRHTHLEHKIAGRHAYHLTMGQAHTAPAVSPRSGFDDEIVHPIQPYQARKSYICPGCESIIDPGVGHIVVVPQEAPDLRRHWHRGCWFKERRRLGHHRSTDVS